MQMKKADLKNAIIGFKLYPNKSWEMAVAESDMLSLVSIEHRLDFYEKQFP